MLRKAPKIPYDATRSGACIVGFDVTAEGMPENVKALRCTESIFAKNSVSALARFRYHPAPHARTGVETKITYRLNDDAGNPLPSLPMPDRVDSPEQPAKIKDKGKLKLMKEKHKGADNYCCLTHDVGADGVAYGVGFGTCKDYDLGRSAWVPHLKSQIKFTPAMNQGKAVVSGPYNTVFWSRSDKVYLGTPADAEKLCISEGSKTP